MRQGSIRAIFVGFLAVQLILPLFVLWGPRPSRFGWQMYSAVRPMPRFEVSIADGSTHEVEVARHVVRARAEVPYGTLLPHHLCGVVPGAEAVLVEWPAEEDEAAETETLRCP